MDAFNAKLKLKDFLINITLNNNIVASAIRIIKYRLLRETALVLLFMFTMLYTNIASVIVLWQYLIMRTHYLYVTIVLSGIAVVMILGATHVIIQHLEYLFSMFMEDTHVFVQKGMSPILKPIIVNVLQIIHLLILHKNVSVNLPFKS